MSDRTRLLPNAVLLAVPAVLLTLIVTVDVLIGVFGGTVKPGIHTVSAGLVMVSILASVSIWTGQRNTAIVLQRIEQMDRTVPILPVRVYASAPVPPRMPLLDPKVVEIGKHLAKKIHDD